MIDFRAAQRRLAKAGYDIGLSDGVAGPRTWAGILAYAAGRPLEALRPYGTPAAAVLPRYGIAETAARVANFVGQATHESGCFRYTREIWGPTPAQRGYEGRKDLGNIAPGDGYTYRGRGIFQITGRANYWQIGKALGLPLEATPALAESPPIAVEAAAWFWHARGLNQLADARDGDAITRRINGGLNGAAERRALVSRVSGLFI